jgi:fatty-acid desaturase
MLDLHTLAEFSRSHCIGICSLLVPANLLSTLFTVILILQHRPSTQIWQAAIAASIFPIIMLLHVYSWFSVGVVMAPTFILLSLAISCLITNLGAMAFHRKLSFREWKVGNQE